LWGTLRGHLLVLLWFCHPLHLIEILSLSAQPPRGLVLQRHRPAPLDIHQDIALFVAKYNVSLEELVVFAGDHGMNPHLALRAAADRSPVHPGRHVDGGVVILVFLGKGKSGRQYLKAEIKHSGVDPVLIRLSIDLCGNLYLRDSLVIPLPESPNAPEHFAILQPHFAKLLIASLLGDLLATGLLGLQEALPLGRVVHPLPLSQFPAGMKRPRLARVPRAAVDLKGGIIFVNGDVKGSLLVLL